jgi:DNA-binding transcriptional LysR family regulator
MGLGISLVNELSARYWNEHLVKLPLDPPQTVTFGVAVPSRENMTSAAKKFLQFAIDFIEE